MLRNPDLKKFGTGYPENGYVIGNYSVEKRPLKKANVTISLICYTDISKLDNPKYVASETEWTLNNLDNNQATLESDNLLSVLKDQCGEYPVEPGGTLLKNFTII